MFDPMFNPMFNQIALAIERAAAPLLSSGLAGGFVTNRTLLIGFVVALFLAFIAKVAFSRHDARQAAQREEDQEVAAVSRDGPPTFNG